MYGAIENVPLSPTIVSSSTTMYWFSILFGFLRSLSFLPWVRGGDERNTTVQRPAKISNAKTFFILFSSSLKVRFRGVEPPATARNARDLEQHRSLINAERCIATHNER